MRRALVVSAGLLLAGCYYYVPYPRSTYIRPGVYFEGGVGAGTEIADRSRLQLSGKFFPISARLGMNPSDVLGFDLNLLPPSLAARVRAGEVNTMLFGETNLGSWSAGIAQGIPFTGLEVVTLGVAAGEWPEEEVEQGAMILPSCTWWPLVLGSVSWHFRSSILRITPSVVGGYYWGAYGEPGRWLLAFTVSGVGREEDLDEQMRWQPTLKSTPTHLTREGH